LKSGFVTLIGRTNSGKSSLLNYLIGENLSLVSHKANATRRKISGIAMNGDDQVIFIDTPGLHESGKLMNKLMIEVALKSIGDADLVLFLASIHDSVENYEKFLAIENLPRHIVILSKTDEASAEKIVAKLTEYSAFADKFEAIIPVSIKKQIYKRQILDEICKFLPEHPYYYDPELISAAQTRDIYRDLILQAVFESVSSEVPYYTDVVVKKVTEKPEIIEIYADLLTDTQSHKTILIGKNGETIKRIGIRARKLISNFSKVKIYIKLAVFVKKSTFFNEKLMKSEFIY